MASIDDRIVAMSFENAKFEAGVAKTLGTLAKLGASLKLTGAAKGLQDVSTAAQKISFDKLGLAADKIKEKLGFSGAAKGLQDVEAASSKINFGTLSGAVDGVKSRFSVMTSAVGGALDTIKSKLGFGSDATKGFDEVEAAGNRVHFAGISSAIETLKGKFGFGGAAVKGFSDIQSAQQRVDFSHITQATDNVGSHFSAMRVTAVTALATIVNSAVNAGISFVKSFTLDPITAGFHNYETQINAVQTILANTGLKGAAGMAQVDAALKDLNTYANLTVYNFSEMTKNIGTFTAAGVGLQQSVAAIKGIANLAALSGSNSQQASSAMYQLSQALAANQVHLQDWNSVVNAGIGGKVFQNALFTTGEALHTIQGVHVGETFAEWTAQGNTFRNSLKDNWINAKVLAQTLANFTGDQSAAQLKAIGYTDIQIKQILAQGKVAIASATNIKTATQLFEALKEEVGTAYAAIFKTVFGNLTTATALFSNIHNVTENFLTIPLYHFNELLKVWDKLGGRKALFDGIKNILTAIGDVLKPIKDAFQQIFPPATGQSIYDLTVKFKNFTEALKIGPETADKIKHTFAGLFAVLDIGKQIVFGIIGAFGHLFSAGQSGAGGILSITGGVGDFLVSIDKMLKRTNAISTFFNTIADIIAVPLHLLGAIASAIGGLFGGFDKTKASGLTSTLDNVNTKLTPVKGIMDGVTRAWEGFLNVMGKIRDALGPTFDAISKAISGFGKIVGDALGNINFNTVLAGLGTGLLGAIFLTLKKALSGGIAVDFGGGVLKGLSTTLGTLNKSLIQLQTTVKAATLVEIGIAVAALAVAIVVLANISAPNLAKSMSAIAVGLGELIGAMALLTKIGGAVGATLSAAALVVLATAVDILSIAIFTLSKLSWAELAKGLVGVGGALLAISVGVKAMPPQILLIGPALIPLAIALNLIAVAVKIFGSLSLESLGKGLLGLAVSLTAIGVAMKLMPLTLPLTAAGLVAVGFALNLIAVAMKIFGSLSLASLAKAMLGLAGSLVAIGVAVSLMPPTLALQAAGLVLVGAALIEIAGAMKIIGALSLGDIVKGLIGIGGALGILAVGLILMDGTLPGAAALLVAAGAFALIAPALLIFATALALVGQLSFGTIIKGLFAIGGVLTVIAVAGVIAAPALALVGVAMLALGAGVGAVGAGVYLLAKGLALLATDGTKGIGVLIASITALIAAVPLMVIGFAKGLVSIVGSVADVAPKLVDAIVKIITSLVDVIAKSAPKMAIAFGAVILAGLTVLRAAVPDIITTGIKLLEAFLAGLVQNISEIVIKVGTIVATFLTSLAGELPKIIVAGANVLVQFLNGVAQSLPRVITSATSIIVNFLQGIAQHLPKVVEVATKVIVTFLEAIASHAAKMIAAGANLVVKILEGIAQNISKVTEAAVTMIGDFIEAAAKAVIHLTDRVAQIIINFLNALAASVRKYTPQLQDAGYNLLSAIIDGALNGVAKLGGKLVDAATGIFGSVIHGIGKKLGIASPSTVFIEIGKQMMAGAVIGVEAGAPAVHQSIEKAGNGMIEAMAKSLKTVPDLLGGLVKLEPVITPVLDLTHVEAGAKRLHELTNVTPITAAASYGQAAAISAAQAAAQAAKNNGSGTAPAAPITFEQNNYSPTSLSPAEVYRQTKNQLAQAKTLLGLTPPAVGIAS